MPRRKNSYKGVKKKENTKPSDRRLSKKIAIAAMFAIFTPATVAFASHGSSEIACKADGYEAGQDGSFSQGLYDTCQEIGAGDAYYNGFIEGCMDADNSREVCEQATDAE
ncbi:MAG: hypothetical protein M3297_13210 [Thermoproteota archaeon]|nr:hypothetical protein [Thermoproteota archaeon]